ncbi:MAG: tetratricopeptide repeat protein [Sulfurimonas sp.]
MKFIQVFLLISLFVFAENSKNVEAEAVNSIESLKEPMYKPFIERYLIDEVKNLRSEQQNLRVETNEKIAQARLDVSDRAMNYMANTVNIIFLILTAVASLIAIFGWKSLKDAREQTKLIVQQRLEEITEEYTQKLNEIEKQMQQRSEDILTNQENISRSDEIHALWRRSTLEENIQAKVDIYDQILSLDKNNVEALTYKADAVLDLGEKEWALNLCNQALEIDDEYAYSYWQRSCVNAELNHINNAVRDIKKAVELSPVLINDIDTEKSFDKIREEEAFVRFLKQDLPLLGKTRKALSPIRKGL